MDGFEAASAKLHIAIALAGGALPVAKAASQPSPAEQHEAALAALTAAVASVEKAKGKGGGAWNKQPRIPSGPKGGEWTTYGGGAYGAGFAMAGQPLVLQQSQGVGPQADSLNARITAMQDHANQFGALNNDAIKLLAKDKPSQTYSAAAYESAKETKGFLDAKAAYKGNTVATPNPTTTDPAPTVNPVKPPPKSTPAGTLGDPMKLSEMKKVGHKPGGSAAGAIYQDADGVKWLVKSYPSPQQAHVEYAASKMYGAMGMATPDMRLIDLKSEFKGGIGIASKFDETLKPLGTPNAATTKALQEDFGAHALLRNHDALGASYDNIMRSADGKMVMVDPGGSLQFKATGDLKSMPVSFKANEIDDMRNKSLNSLGAETFGPMSQSDLAASMSKALAGATDKDGKLSSAMVDAINNAMPPSAAKSTIDMMQKRADDMRSRLDGIEAAQATTMGATMANVGTHSALSHDSPKVQAMLANDPATLKNIEDAAYDASDKQWLKVNPGSAKENFYLDKMGAAEDAYKAGDIGFFANGPDKAESGIVGLSTNHIAYETSFHSLHNATAAKVAASMKAQMGGETTVADAKSTVNTSSFVKTPADVAAAKIASGDATPIGTSQNQIDALQAQTVAPAKPAPAPLAVLPPIPPKPSLSSPANPNKGINNIADEIVKVAASGSPDAAAQVHHLASQIKGSNSFAVKAKTWASNVVASLGGTQAITALDGAAKAAASMKAVAAGTKAINAGKIEALSALKVTKTIKVSEFDAKLVPSAPKVSASSKADINAKNQAMVDSIYAMAVQNDLEGVKNFDPSPSKGVAEYKANVLAYFSTIGVATEVSTFVNPGISAAAAYDEVAANFTTKNINPDGSQQKFGDHAVITGPGADIGKWMYDAMPSLVEKKYSSKTLGALADKTNSTTLAQQQAFYSHVGTGKFDGTNYDWAELAESLRKEKNNTKTIEAAKHFAKVSVSGMYELPEGLRITRNVSAYKSADEWRAMIGNIVTQPGQSSTSVTPGVWSGKVILNMKVGRGVKGAYLGESGQATTTTKLKGKTQVGLDSEDEVLLPHGSRWLVTGVRNRSEVKGDDLLGYNATNGKITDDHIIVDVIVLPHDMSDI